MIRTIIQIDEEKCDGCGLCVRACHEGALGIVDGKARLLRDDYCDGMGDCLPACPADAISFIEREAAAYDEAAVKARMAAAAASDGQASSRSALLEAACSGGCAENLEKLVKSLAAFESQNADELESDEPAKQLVEASSDVKRTLSLADQPELEVAEFRLGNWPIQIKLAPVCAPYFNGSHLLVAADCTAFAYGAFHAHLAAGRVTLIGCPKLDGVDYAEKLTAIIAENDVRGVVVARMQVPCCGGIQSAVLRAVEASGKDIPVEVVTISTGGEVLA